MSAATPPKPNPDEAKGAEALKRALVAVRDLRARLDAVEQARHEPIAIVGMGCRLPGGVEDTEAFWRLLREGREAVGEVPKERWDIEEFYDPDPEAPGRTYARTAAFVNGVDLFDAPFFGISPREALSMDPQQRLLLEVAWEALERAGQSPEELRGSDTGVFIGISTSDYSQIVQRLGGDRIDPYTGTGGAFCVAAGRISFTLGLHGPNLAVDTACSSALVAIQLAVQSLRSGACPMALAGGVNLMLAPEATVYLSKVRALSTAGHCRTFDAAADGYVRGEGCGVLVLKRLSDARAHGDTVLAVIRGAAVNHDGKSGGLTVPNAAAQQLVLRQALADARVAARDVAYVEAHGTGTPLGDPIEVRALMAVMGEGRSADQPLVLGSAKTNIGHLEAAAGVAGLMKVVLSLQHGEIPPHLHFDHPSPHIDWDTLPVKVPKTLQGWPEGRKIGGVSSFGFSGTNAHVILEEAPAEEPVAPGALERPLHVLTLSATSEEALVALAARYRASLSAPEGPALADVCFTANAGRSHFPHRLAVVAGSLPQVAEALAGLDRGEAPGVVRGVAPLRRSPKVAFLFTGQGSQYAGMGRSLYETQPAFKKALDRCSEITAGRLDKALLDVMFGAPGTEGLIDRTGYTQPCLFALEWALAEVWRSWGVEPGAVMGHSVGEYVAAAVSGVLSLEDALGLIIERARLMESLPAGGTMVAVQASEERVREALGSDAAPVSVAAVNGPSSVVVSGASEPVRRVVDALEKAGIKTKPLQVSHAFHSALLDPMLADLERAASKVERGAPSIGLVSNLTGRFLTEGEATPAYWRQHARETVRFADSMRVLEEKGYDVFVELGPHPVLLGMARACVAEGSGSWVPSLRKGREDWPQMLEGVAKLYVGGVVLDWAGFDQDYHRRRVVLPTYPFQRRRYWIEGQPERRQGPKAGLPTGYKDWLCDLEWPLAARETTAPVEPGRWLVCGRDSGPGPALLEALRGKGHQAILATTGPEFEVSAEGFALDPTQPEQVDRLMGEATRGGPLMGVVHLWGLGPPEGVDPLETQRQVSGTALHLAQTMARHAEPARLWLVTCGAQAVAGPLPNVDQASLWGLGRTLFVEQPHLSCVCVDLDPESEGGDGLVAELLSPPGPENQIALRGEERRVARLVKSRLLGSPDPPPLRLGPDATYLVTGGLRGIGFEVAKWLVDRGARYLVLLGRRPPADSETMAIRALEARGVRVETVSADVADLSALTAVFARIDTDLPPVRGIVHCAGVLDDALLLQQSWPRLAAVMAPKVQGAANLDALTQQRPLDFFVLFSSASTLLATPGRTGYAAANAWLDALAHHRRDQGLRATVVNWSVWAEVGMAAGVSNAARLSLESRGLYMIPPGAGLDALNHILGKGVTQTAVLPIDWPTFVGLHPEPPPLFAGMAAKAAAAGSIRPLSKSREPYLLTEIAAAAESERPDLLSSHVRKEALKVLGLDADHPLNPDQPLSDLGLDSLMAVELRNLLGAALGTALPPTLLFDYPTVNALAGLLADKIPAMRKEPVAAEPAKEERKRDAMVAEIKQLSESEVEAAIARELGTLGA